MVLTEVEKLKIEIEYWKGRGKEFYGVVQLMFLELDNLDNLEGNDRNEYIESMIEALKSIRLVYRMEGKKAYKEFDK